LLLFICGLWRKQPVLTDGFLRFCPDKNPSVRRLAAICLFRRHKSLHDHLPTIFHFIPVQYLPSFLPLYRLMVILFAELINDGGI
jgi:hypothetical protein